MSKLALKKELTKLTKEKLILHVLDLYENNKAVKEFYNHFLNPQNEEELAKKYKKLIRKEFNVENPMKCTVKFSVAKKAISDFKSLQPYCLFLADVMLYLPESACELTSCFGDFSEQFYNSAWSNYEKALEFIHHNGLLEEFRVRAERCVKWASNCGYGFADDIEDVFEEYYNN
jgi:hypothetical protein